MQNNLKKIKIINLYKSDCLCCLAVKTSLSLPPSPPSLVRLYSRCAASHFCLLCVNVYVCVLQTIGAPPSFRVLQSERGRDVRYREPLVHSHSTELRPIWSQLMWGQVLARVELWPRPAQSATRRDASTSHGGTVMWPQLLLRGWEIRIDVQSTQVVVRLQGHPGLSRWWILDVRDPWAGQPIRGVPVIRCRDTTDDES